MSGFGLQGGGNESAYFAPASFTADGSVLYFPCQDGTFTTIGAALQVLVPVSAQITTTATTIVRGDGVSWLSAAGGLLTNVAQRITVRGLRGANGEGVVLQVSGVTATTITFASALAVDAVNQAVVITINVLGSSCQSMGTVCIESIELTALPATNPAVLSFCTPDGVAIPGRSVTFPTSGIALPYNYPVSGQGGLQVNGQKLVGTTRVGGWGIKISGSPTALGFLVNYRRVA